MDFKASQPVNNSLHRWFWLTALCSHWAFHEGMAEMVDAIIKVDR
jgi:hypothetical protein